MSLIIDGILSQKLPWGLVLLGVSISIVLELCGIASLPFAVGVYLPMSVSTPVFVGGVMRWMVDRRRKKAGLQKSESEAETSPGVLFSSGLIAGGAIAGIGLALISIYEKLGSAMDLSKLVPAIAGSQMTAVIAFGIMVVLLGRSGLKKE